MRHDETLRLLNVTGRLPLDNARQPRISEAGHGIPWIGAIGWRPAVPLSELEAMAAQQVAAGDIRIGGVLVARRPLLR